MNINEGDLITVTVELLRDLLQGGGFVAGGVCGNAGMRVCVWRGVGG